jgi:hypothetical protein
VKWRQADRLRTSNELGGGSRRLPALSRRLPSLGAAVVALLGLGALAFGQAPIYRPKAETLPRAIAPQPVAFSHRLHSSVGLGCVSCHVGAEAQDFAELPTAESCMTCHATIKTDSAEVGKIAAAAASNTRLRWVRAYQVPDFVFFSHREHVSKGEKCATCHGPVETRDVLEQEVSTGMNACLDCHRTKGAPVQCAACHQLGH